MLTWIGVLFLVAACSSDKGFVTEKVSADDYGAQWPLTVDTAALGCEPGYVPTITVGGHSFQVDTIAGTADADPKFRRIWAQDSELGDGSRRYLTPLVIDANALCD